MVTVRRKNPLLTGRAQGEQHIGLNTYYRREQTKVISM